MRLIRALRACTFACLLAGTTMLSAQGQGVGSIDGTVFEDLNGNGKMDAGEPPIPGWDINLVHENGGGTTMAMTDDQGNYQFTDLPFGDYDVIPELRQGYEQTYPGGVGYNHTTLNASKSVSYRYGFQKPCVKITTDKLLCLTERPGGYSWTFTICNLSNFPISHIYFLQSLPAGVTIDFTGGPNNYLAVNPPMNPGDCRQFTVHISGATPGSTICWDMSVHNANHKECCFFRFCLTVPECDCVQFLDESIKCDPTIPGGYLWCFTIQVLAPGPVNWLLLSGPTGVVFNPAVVPLPGLVYGQTYNVCINITGVASGQQLCFTLSLHDELFKLCCSIEHCIDLPDCSQGCELAPGICAAGKPHYQDPKFGAFTGTVASVTCWTDISAILNPVLAVMNLDAYQSAPPALGMNWAPVPLGYHGPADSWNRKNLGTIFGETIDRKGNIYVAHSSCFAWINTANADGWGPGGAAAIYKIDASSGGISTLVGTGSTAGSSLPNASDANVIAQPPFTVNDSYPGLGNITYDYDNDQLFVTDMEDGRIYRISMGGFVLSSFDPMGADGGSLDPGFAPLGERLWACEYHRGRVYYSVWARDAGPMTYPSGNPRQNAALSNQIRSVAVNPPSSGGDFIPNSDRVEIASPDYPNLPGVQYSMPVSDISFSPEGYLGVAERGMDSDTSSTPHRSRGMEFRCDPLTVKWALFGGPSDSAFSIGLGGRNSAGGIDYDYDKTNEGQTPKGRRVWWTGDCLGGFIGNNICEIYGLQGVPISGGDAGGAPATGSILLDLDGNPAQAKITLGDVEIPCPQAQPGSTSTGMVILEDNAGSPSGEPVLFQLLDNMGGVVAEQTTNLDSSGHYTVNWNQTGVFSLRAKGRTWLSQKNTGVDLDPDVPAVSNFSLTNGDAQDDNAVNLPDLNSVFIHFGEIGFNSADLDCSGEVDLKDLNIVFINFGIVGK